MGLCSGIHCPWSLFPGQLLEERIPGQEQGKVTSPSKTPAVTNPSAPPFPGGAGEHPTILQCCTPQVSPDLKVAPSVAP